MMELSLLLVRFWRFFLSKNDDKWILIKNLYELLWHLLMNLI